MIMPISIIFGVPALVPVVLLVLLLLLTWLMMILSLLLLKMMMRSASLNLIMKVIRVGIEIPVPVHV